MIFKHAYMPHWSFVACSDHGKYQPTIIRIAPRTWSGSEKVIKGLYEAQSWQQVAPTELSFWKD